MEEQQYKGLISEKDFYKKVNDYRMSHNQQILTWEQYQETLKLMAENSQIIRMIMEVKES